MTNQRIKSALHIKLTPEQRGRLTILARGSGFNTVSSYVRFMIFNPSFDMKLNRILEVVKDIQEKVDTPDKTGEGLSSD